jgi:hypothetical protein
MLRENVDAALRGIPVYHEKICVKVRYLAHAAIA